MLTLPYLTLATELARKAHAGQTRKGFDEPYIAHPIRVALMASEAGLSEEAVAAAVLHDVVEDTAVTFADLQVQPLPPRTLELVAILSKWWGESKHEPRAAEYKRVYYARILADPDALVLKILDRTDNLRDMRRALPGLRGWAAAYLKKTKREFAPLATACPRISVVERFLREARALESALAGGREP